MSAAFAVTFFPDEYAATKREEECTLDDLADKIRVTAAATKSGLPFLKLAKFGWLRAPPKEDGKSSNSLRHDANVQAVTGVEADYDYDVGKKKAVKKISLEEAVAIIKKAGLRTLLYTTPSHTAERPRWRALCPTSEALSPWRRSELTDKLNKLFDGNIAEESWSISQSYYYGRSFANTSADHRVVIVDGDYIDLRDDIEGRGRINGKAHAAAPVDCALELARIRSGAEQHQPAKRFISHHVAIGTPKAEIQRTLLRAFAEVPEEKRHRVGPDGRARWPQHKQEIDDLIKWAEATEAEKHRREFAKAEGLSDEHLAFVAKQAALPAAAYDRGRKSAALEIGVKVTTLDRLVKEYRRATQPAASEPTQADTLLGIAQQAELFHTAEGTPYADIIVDGHRETWPIDSKAFRDWLTREYFTATSTAPASYGMDAALSLIQARARFDAPARDVYLRTARSGPKIFLDLCDDKWRVVEIDKTGWRIVAAPDVRFRRAAGMLPLPDPVKGGSIDDLRRFINVPAPPNPPVENFNDDSFVLSVGWMIGTLSGAGPYAVLVVSGEHGAAKTFYSRVLRDLVDPNKVPLRALPRHDHDLYIAGGNAHLLAFDNISTLPDWLSDTLCRLSTGGGFAARELYTDADEKLFDGMRPLMLNGIENFVMRPDLGDRSIVLVLEEIPADKRRTEADLLKEFEVERPKILGALLDVVAHGLCELAVTKLASLPRMADFALWVAACEGAMPWKEGTFEEAYARNRQSGQIDLLEGDAVAAVMQKFAKEPPRRLIGEKHGTPDYETEKDWEKRIKAGSAIWEGTAAKLLEHLNEENPSIHCEYATKEMRRNRSWPTSARQLSGRLRRVAPVLRQVGVEITFARGHESKITVSTPATSLLAAQGGGG